MTAPEDDDHLAETLRRALNRAVDGVEPGADGLERIRARTSRRPRPWHIAVASAVIERARNWVWRGHWVWPRPSLPKNFPRPRAVSAVARGNWARPGAVLAGVGVIAAVTLAVTPLRQAIVQASSAVLTGGQTAAVLGTNGSGGGALNGNGTQGAYGQTSPQHVSTYATTRSATPAGSPGKTGCTSAKTDSGGAEADNEVAATTVTSSKAASRVSAEAEAQDPGPPTIRSAYPFPRLAAAAFAATMASPSARPSASASCSASASTTPTATASVTASPAQPPTSPPALTPSSETPSQTPTPTPTPSDTASPSPSPDLSPSTTPSPTPADSGSANNGVNQGSSTSPSADSSGSPSGSASDSSPAGLRGAVPGRRGR